MLPTSIRHGDLVIDFQEHGCVQVVRQSNMQGIVLSLTEWNYLLAVADIHGYPVVSPFKATPEVPT